MERFGAKTDQSYTLLPLMQGMIRVINSVAKQCNITLTFTNLQTYLP